MSNTPTTHTTPVVRMSVDEAMKELMASMTKDPRGGKRKRAQRASKSRKRTIGKANDSTGNMWVCVEKGRRCVVILSNDVRAEALFPAIVTSILGKTGMPWAWEYGAQDWAKE